MSQGSELIGGPRADHERLHYSPHGMYMWDTWYLQQGDVTHLFHLQVKRPNSTRPDVDEGTIGHAVSRDLLHWEELPTALHRGVTGPSAYDDGPLYTGCAVEHAGMIHLFYCGNSRIAGAPRGRQSVCLATSTDGGKTFQKHPANPIIEPDTRYYYGAMDPLTPFPHHAHNATDCRDLAVVKNPSGDGWLGYVVMRRKGQEDAFHSACIALCRSKDLVHWEVGQPCCTPNRFNCFEVPDVFEIDGKWYMIALTGDLYGQTKRWSDPEITCATVVFQADRPEGPFEEVKDNLLLASKKNIWQGFSARTVERNGERLMIYTRCEGVNGRGRLSWPVKLVAKPDGGLLPKYWNGYERGFRPPQTVSDIIVDSDSSLKQNLLDEISAGDKTYMIHGKVKIDRGEAGIGFGLDGKAGGYLALLSPTEGPNGLVKLASAEGSVIADRQFRLSTDRSFDLRIVVVEEMVEIYLDDVLLIDFFMPQLRPGQIALVAKGRASLTNIKYRSGLTEK